MSLQLAFRHLHGRMGLILAGGGHNVGLPDGDLSNVYSMCKLLPAWGAGVLRITAVNAFGQ